MNTLRFMEKRDYITITPNQGGNDEKQFIVKIVKNGKYPLKYMKMLISPFIESYWVGLSFLK